MLKICCFLSQHLILTVFLINTSVYQFYHHLKLKCFYLFVIISANITVNAVKNFTKIIILFTFKKITKLN